jgi:hypothetical protein
VVHRTVSGAPGWLEQSGCSRDFNGGVRLYFTGLSGGAPDCPVGRSQANSSLSGIHRRRTTIIHRTIRCAPDCPVSQRSVGPTVGRAICAGHVAEPTASRRHRTVRCAPDMSGAPTGSLAANGRLRHLRKEIRHRTVRCASRQKARSAFLGCSQRLLAALGL